MLGKFGGKHTNTKGIIGARFARRLYGSVRPRKKLLDAVDVERPIGIIFRDIHSMLVNPKALELAGIPKDTPNPKGGHIVRNPITNEPSVLLQEEFAMQLVQCLFPNPSKED